MKTFLLFALCLPALSVAHSYTNTAQWTGAKRFVKTPSGRDAISCEYRYAGNTFWRDFVDIAACPATVETE